MTKLELDISLAVRKNEKNESVSLFARDASPVMVITGLMKLITVYLDVTYGLPPSKDQLRLGFVSLVCSLDSMACDLDVAIDMAIARIASRVDETFVGLLVGLIMGQVFLMARGVTT